MNELRLSELYIYPVKSLGGISLSTAKVEQMGLEHDRRWMLIDENGLFVSQRKYAELALLQVSLHPHELTITHKHHPEVSISFGFHEYTEKPIAVTIWDDNCHGLEVSEEVSAWFSAFMNKAVKLVSIPKDEKRMVDQRYAKNGEIVGFSDGYPFLIISQASLNGLNEKLEQPVPMDRFRPNFVFTGGDAHLEDQFDTFTIGTVRFSAVKPCARCVLTTVDQRTAIKSAEPLKTLSGYRLINKKVMFGQNLLQRNAGTIHLGDMIRVESWKPAI